MKGLLDDAALVGTAATAYLTVRLSRAATIATAIAKINTYLHIAQTEKVARSGGGAVAAMAGVSVVTEFALAASVLMALGLDIGDEDETFG